MERPGATNERIPTPVLWWYLGLKSHERLTMVCVVKALTLPGASTGPTHFLGLTWASTHALRDSKRFCFLFQKILLEKRFTIQKTWKGNAFLCCCHDIVHKIRYCRFPRIKVIMHCPRAKSEREKGKERMRNKRSGALVKTESPRDFVLEGG